MTSIKDDPSSDSREAPMARRTGERGHLTVGELVRLLSAYPEDLRVVVDGYEGGYDDLVAERIQRLPIGLHVNAARWDGPHDDARYGFPERTDAVEVVEALALHRKPWP